MSVSALKRLAIHKMSLDAIPRGGGLADGVRFLSSPATIARSARAAEKWARDAVNAVRMAAEPNPWRQASDEEIAEEILRRVAERKAVKR